MEEPLIIETKNKIIKLYTKAQANEYADQGYKLHTFQTIIVDGVPQDQYIMMLDTGYGDVIRVADAPEQLANDLLALDEGWEVASTSVSARFYRMVKRDTTT